MYNTKYWKQRRIKYVWIKKKTNINELRNTQSQTEIKNKIKINLPLKFFKLNSIKIKSI